MPSEPDIPYADIARFVRTLTHDLRNGLNSIELETGLLEELVADSSDDFEAAMGRIRTQSRAITTSLQTLSARFREPEPYRAPVPARELLSLWREQANGLSPAITWEDRLGGEVVAVDSLQMMEVFRELLENAVTFDPVGPIVGSARAGVSVVDFELREQKSGTLDPATWGRTPFHTTSAGRFGLGLWWVHRVAAENGIAVTREFLPDHTLITRLSIPVLVRR